MLVFLLLALAGSISIDDVCSYLAEECGASNLDICYQIGDQCGYMPDPQDQLSSVIVCGKENTPMMERIVMDCGIFTGDFKRYGDLYPQEQPEDDSWRRGALYYVGDDNCISTGDSCVPIDELVDAGVCTWGDSPGMYYCDPQALDSYVPKAERSLSELVDLLNQYLPKLKNAIKDSFDFLDYLARVEAISGKKIVKEEEAIMLASDFDWGAYERMMNGIGYDIDEDERELFKKNPEIIRKGAREQVIRKAIVAEGVAKATELLEVSTEGYEHDVGTHWGTFMFLLDMLQAGAYSTVSKLEAIKSAAESIVTNQVDNIKNMYMDEDNLLALGAKFALEAHQGYVEARATGVGYPPQRFLYGCKRGKYDNMGCEQDEETGTYRVKINGKEVVVSHFIRMKDKQGKVYWVGTDDPEAVDEEALQHATIILREVDGWLWKSDNVEIIDPKTWEVISEEDLPGMFG